jgi:hypothetical protein
MRMHLISIYFPKATYQEMEFKKEDAVPESNPVPPIFYLIISGSKDKQSKAKLSFRTQRLTHNDVVGDVVNLSNMKEKNLLNFTTFVDKILSNIGIVQPNSSEA